VVTRGQCPDGNKDDVLNRNQWAVPLCSSTKTPHWILATADFGKKEIVIYDSSPEFCSSWWATPVIDKVLRVLGGEAVNWDKWNRRVVSPDELEGQIDDWACGLFVLMSLRCFMICIDYQKWCQNSLKEKMSQSCLEALQALPCVPF